MTNPNNDQQLTNVIVRGGIWLLTAVELAVGLLATLAPRTFYDDVPWVSLSPPFAEHLMRDYGAMNLALGLVSAVAALTMDRRMVRTAFAAYLLFAVPHLLFHITHLDHHTTTSAITETTALTIAALLPLALLALTWRPSPAAASRKAPEPIASKRGAT